MKILKTITIIAATALTLFTSCNHTEKSATTTAAIDTQKNINKEQSQPVISGYGIGDIATDFSLQNIDDSMVSLKDFQDAKGFVVIFTCNHCPFSVAYEDRIIAIDKEFKEKGYPVIAINPNNPDSYPEDSFDNMKKRAAQKGFTFPYLLDKGQIIYPQYGATKTPHVFLLQKENNNNIVKYIGAIDDNHKDASAVKNHYLKDAINALLQNQPIKNQQTVAIGCSIKK